MGFLKESEVIDKIKSILKIKNNKFNTEIEFIGFKEGKYIGINNTHLILRCKKHNYIWDTTTFGNLKNLNKITRCKFCIDNIINTPEKALNKVLEIHQNDGRGYDYSKILTTFKGVKEKVTITCPIHGDFEITYNVLIRKPNKRRKNIGGICPKCRLEKHINSKKHSEEDAIKNIEKALVERNNTYGTNIEFLGFVGGEYKNTKTKLILKCNKHNLVWTSTCYNTFTIRNSFRGPLCPSCDQERRFSRISDHENICINEVSKYFTEDLITLQYCLYNCYYDLLGINMTLFLDIFIKDKENNVTYVIEYNGKQHTDYIRAFHKNYNDYVRQVNRDKFLEKICKQNGWKLLNISYKDNNRIPEILKAFFEEGKDITTKVEPKLLPIPYGENIINRS